MLKYSIYVCVKYIVPIIQSYLCQSYSIQLIFNTLKKVHKVYFNYIMKMFASVIKKNKASTALLKYKERAKELSQFYINRQQLAKRLSANQKVKKRLIEPNLKS